METICVFYPSHEVRAGITKHCFLNNKVSQAGCDEFAGTAGPEATTETGKRDRDMSGKERSWYISRTILVIF